MLRAIDPPLSVAERARDLAELFGFPVIVQLVAFGLVLLLLRALRGRR
jgi:hypothetical protein